MPKVFKIYEIVVRVWAAAEIEVLQSTDTRGSKLPARISDALSYPRLHRRIRGDRTRGAKVRKFHISRKSSVSLAILAAIWRASSLTVRIEKSRLLILLVQDERHVKSRDNKE